jgi:hypothetical protein
MTVESATKIHQLVPGNPGVADPVSEGASHIRTIKTALLGSLPAFGVGGDSGTLTLGADAINGFPAELAALVASIATKSDVGHTHATLTRGNGLSGGNYNGGTAQTWAVLYGTSAGTATQGNDPRLAKEAAVHLRNANTTLTQALSNGVIFSDNATAYTYTLDDTAAIGAIWVIQNMGWAPKNITIATGGHTLNNMTGDGVNIGTGNRILVRGGVAVITKLWNGIFTIFGGGIL